MYTRRGRPSIHVLSKPRFRDLFLSFTNFHFSIPHSNVMKCKLSSKMSQELQSIGPCFLIQVLDVTSCIVYKFFLFQMVLRAGFGF